MYRQKDRKNLIFTEEKKMPSKKCPECGRITTSGNRPDFCTRCGCSLKGQPFLSEMHREKEPVCKNRSEICNLYSTSEGKPLFCTKNCENTQISETSGADADYNIIKNRREEKADAPLQMNLFKT